MEKRTQVEIAMRWVLERTKLERLMHAVLKPCLVANLETDCSNEETLVEEMLILADN